MKFNLFPAWVGASSVSSDNPRGLDDSDEHSNRLPEGLRSALGSILSINTRVATFEEVIKLN